VRFFGQWNPFGRIWQHKRLIAITAGVIMAAVPLIGFDYWLSDLVQRQTQEDSTQLAKRAIDLAETRLTRAVSALVTLRTLGADSCTPDDITMIRAVLLTATPVKDIAVVGDDGKERCSQLGSSVSTVLMSEPITRPVAAVLETVRLTTGSTDLYQRVRLLADGNHAELAAFIPSDLFIPMIANEEAALRPAVRIITRSGAVLVQSHNNDARIWESGAAFGVASSDRYGFTASAALPRTRDSSTYRDLSKISLFVPGAIAVLIMAFAALLPRRQPVNPVAELQQAIRDGEFVPYYQPVVDIRSGRIVGAEVLARWKKPDGSLVLPGSFIPLAESSGLIVELTQHLMRRVCIDAGPAIGARPGLKIGFNFSAALFSNRNTVRDVRKMFSNSPIALSQVVLELTEREQIADLTEARQVIAALQGIGVRIALDDVGTGHSGLSYMLKLGVDIIKIDKMFVDAIGTDRKSSTIVETLVDLAHNMRMDIIAEGVENFEQVAHLRELGIRSAQGYVFAPPLPGSAFIKLIEAIEPAAAEQPAEPRYLAARQRIAAM